MHPDVVAIWAKTKDGAFVYFGHIKLKVYLLLCRCNRFIMLLNISVSMWNSKMQDYMLLVFLTLSLTQVI